MTSTFFQQNIHKSADHEVLESAIHWLEHIAQQPAKPQAFIYFITVIKTWGSSPRPVGSVMAINPNGYTVGSVSGGCVEQTLRDQLSNSAHNPHNFPQLFKYGISKAEAQRFGLPCGGCLELVVEKLDTSAQLQTALDKIEKRQLISRHVCINTGEVSFSNNIPDSDFSYSPNSINKVFGPSWHLLIIGAGHLSQIIASMALALNYHVIVCDPRKNYMKNWHIELTEMDEGMPDDVVKKTVTDSRCAVLALTHDANLDDMALMEALDSCAFYVGALGSKKTNDNRRKRLVALGVSNHGINRLHGPIGLPIGSRTPAEIAVSILAELTAIRHGKKLVLSDQNFDGHRLNTACVSSVK
ncbi:MAG: XdhC family protein [Gammaproteobacteria bacterium]|nr:XdhC family protein [Gammaproteobacteria bacterium]